jgi:hypothetical protein
MTKLTKLQTLSLMSLSAGVDVFDLVEQVAGKQPARLTKNTEDPDFQAAENKRRRKQQKRQDQLKKISASKSA